MSAAGDRSGQPEILIDQGLADDFLVEQLKPQLFADACQSVNQSLRLRQHEGYDHSYFFIASFIDDHIAHHSRILNG
jgi:S-formylglutathione hydrolase